MAIDGIWLWGLFGAFIVGMLVLDLGVFRRKAREVRPAEALVWCAVWVSLAAVFNVGLFIFGGSQKGLEFLTGYLIEYSLSVDNIFIFLLVFSYFMVPKEYQHKVLFWGILGALVMRAIMIALGATLIKEFHWVIYFFGALLIFSGIKMALQRNVHMDPEKNLLVRLFKRIMPVTSGYHGSKFFVLEAGRRAATPLFLALLVVESADLMFAVDSIPAIFAITTDPMIVYTSNVFAILGLRSLYFALAGLIDRFHYLQMGLSVVLVFVGMKMLLADIFKIPVALSLAVVALVLAVSVVASLLKSKPAEVPGEVAASRGRLGKSGVAGPEVA